MTSAVMQIILCIEGQFSRMLFSLFYFWVWYDWENVQPPSPNNLRVHIFNSRKKIYSHAAVVIKGEITKTFEVSWSLLKSHEIPWLLRKSHEVFQVSWNLMKSPEVSWSHTKSWSPLFPLGRDGFQIILLISCLRLLWTILHLIIDKIRWVLQCCTFGH
jgi:hypothetical protein